MTRDAQLMIQGMDMLLRKFNKYPDNTLVKVTDIIEAANDIYDEIARNDAKR